MEANLILKEIANNFHSNKDKYAAHTKIKKLFEELCQDMSFIHNLLKFGTGLTRSCRLIPMDGPDSV